MIPIKVAGAPFSRAMRGSRSHQAMTAAALLLLSATPAHPWGSDGHRLVNEYAVDNLPSEMVSDGSGNAFGDNRAFLGDHSTDPDWQKRYDADESVRHWCDIDERIYEYPPPFTSVPRDFDEYDAAFGIDAGIIQWGGIRNHYDSLVGLMRAGNWYVAYQRAAELGHYVGDATVPLHATVHFDGYQWWHPLYDERNAGIHERYEEWMVSRFIGSLATTPGSAAYVADRVESAFTLISGGWCLFDEILAADLEAQDIAGDGNFNDLYYQELYARVGADAQARLELAAKTLSDLWYSAWIDAGRPSFAPGAMKINFQPLEWNAPPGWGIDRAYPYGPFGACGWR